MDPKGIDRAPQNISAFCSFVRMKPFCNSHPVTRPFLFLVLLSLPILNLQAQQSEESEKDEEKLIQFSGVVVRSDSLTPIPFTHVVIESEKRGTVADANGYFSIVAQTNDTILFSSIGFKTNTFIIPDSLDKSNYSLIHTMEQDTVETGEMVVHPWPSKEEFKQAFMNADVPTDDIERARQNLAQAEMKERMENMDMDGSMNYKYQMQQYSNKVYHAGQAPPISILNPSAWAEFIKAWREGRFKD